jgi:hypothetical protein
VVGVGSRVGAGAEGGGGQVVGRGLQEEVEEEVEMCSA